MKKKGGRANQKLRTRFALLDAAVALIGEGRQPSVADAAERALVSRATAYRYFPSQEGLLNEAVLHAGMVTADRRLSESFDRMEDPEDRVDAAERELHDVAYEREFQSRLMLRISLDQWLQEGGKRARLPRRQARRRDYFAEALGPIRAELPAGVYRNLLASLCALTGVEALIALHDILGLDRKQARKVKSWAVRALVREARRQSSARKASRKRNRRPQG